ncbi:MAG: hypothetical protein ACTHMP_14860, partial [Thermomicrobiales bacterium]
RFLDYWQNHGGLAINGYPISDEHVETLEGDHAYTVQYFERVRMEYHPENQPPYDVLLGQFGRRVLSTAYAGDYREYQKAVAPAAPIPGQAYFSVTGHNVDSRFFDYWQQHGGLAQFGYPITEQRSDWLEDGPQHGQQYVTQYFERARFEYHPENQPPYDVLLGQFGRQIMAENALLTGDFQQLYFSNEQVRERLGAPSEPAAQGPGATQEFEHGRMVWRGDKRWIYVLQGDPGSGSLVEPTQYQACYVDTWQTGDPEGGGPAPTPGLFYPKRGFGKIWREMQPWNLQSLLGYALTPDETGYTITVQAFGGGFMLTSDTSAGHFFYVVYFQRTSHAGYPITTYERYALLQR